MARQRVASIAALAFGVGIVALPARAAEAVRLRGSSLVFERLDGLRGEIARWLPNLSVEWYGGGTGAGFISLFDGSADVAVSTRPIEDREKALASRLSLQLREYVLALDGVAVIVHPDNPVDSLSTGQLATLFAGTIVAWHGVGGSSLDVRLLRPPPSSGTFELVKDRILEGAQIASSAEIAETEDAAIDLVASDPRAIALVSMSRDRSRVKTIPLKLDDSSAALLPTPESVAVEEYPLTRAIRLYVRGEPDEKLRRLLSFIVLSDGQEKVEEGGLVPVFADRPIQRVLPSRSSAGGAAVARVLFRFGESRLHRASRGELDEIAKRALAGTGEVWITGHVDSNEGRSRDGSLSEERARAVQSYLAGLGVKAFQVEGRGAAEPLSALDGQGDENRRADVWLLPRR